METGSGGDREGIGMGLKGKYRSSVDAREPQHPTKSEEYQTGGLGGPRRTCPPSSDRPQATSTACPSAGWRIGRCGPH
eukprot:8658203-Pyramimonas_sp.AAC.1